MLGGIGGNHVWWMAYRISRKGEAVNMICIVKGDQKYIWFFTDSQRENTKRNIGEMASNPDFDFNWHDAAKVLEQVRQ